MTGSTARQYIRSKPSFTPRLCSRKGTAAHDFCIFCIIRNERHDVRHRRGRPHPDGSAARFAEVVLRSRPRRLRDQGRPRPCGDRRRPGPVRDHGAGAPGRRGPDPGAPGGREGRHPDERPGAHHQQGVPLRPRRHRAGRPAHPRGRVRRGRGRRPGVHDQRPPPAAEVPRGLQVRRGAGARRHGARRSDRLLREHRHGRVDREAQHPPRHRPPRAGRDRRPVPPAGRRRAEERPLRGRDHPGRDPAAQGRPGAVQQGRGHPRRHHRRVPRQAAPGVRQGRHHHRRLLLADLGRRRRRGRDEQGQGAGAGPGVDRRDRGPRQRGRPRQLAPVAAVERHPPRPEEGGPGGLRPRPDRDQRGLRRGCRPVNEGPGRFHRKGERQRWRHRPRSPDRDVRRAAGAAPGAGAEAAGRRRRRRGAVRWRRPG
ncbi:hypothetical protein LRR80_04123 [Streptomyces sp. RO-S4]|nr:hypothetical protein [Streptomyces sp. RO-S4]